MWVFWVVVAGEKNLREANKGGYFGACLSEFKILLNQTSLGLGGRVKSSEKSLATQK